MPNLSMKLLSVHPMILAAVLVIQAAGVRADANDEAELFIVHDALFKREFARRLAFMEEEGRLLSRDDTLKQLGDSSGAKVDIRQGKLARRNQEPPKDLYKAVIPGVLVLGTASKGDDGEQPLLAQSATAWALTRDGWCLSNRHVLEAGGGWGVSDHQGRVYPVVQIMASDELADIVLFRVDVGDDELNPLPLASELQVGQPVAILSHPAGQLYFFSAGRVARFYQREDEEGMSEWMSVTADFAVGSSGGPVINRRGEVVGMVASTLAINAIPPQGGEKEFQMVLRDCIPLHVLRDFLISR